MSYWFASLKQFLKLISAWAYEGHPRNALTSVANPLCFCSAGTSF